MPASQVTTIAIDAGLTDPIESLAGRSAPISTSATTMITTSASSTGMSEPTRNVSDCVREAAASQRTSTIVWIAIPPIRLPAASERWPLAAAETVIATSGSVPAIASRMTPPNASPRSKRRSIASVDFESAVPAIQVATAAAPRTPTRTIVEREPIGSLFRAAQTVAGRRSGKRGRPSSGIVSQTAA